MKVASISKKKTCHSFSPVPCPHRVSHWMGHSSLSKLRNPDKVLSTCNHGLWAAMFHCGVDGGSADGEYALFLMQRYSETFPLSSHQLHTWVTSVPAICGCGGGTCCCGWGEGCCRGCCWDGPTTVPRRGCWLLGGLYTAGLPSGFTKGWPAMESEHGPGEPLISPLPERTALIDT